MHDWGDIGQKIARYCNFCIFWLKIRESSPPLSATKLRPWNKCMLQMAQDICIHGALAVVGTGTNVFVLLIKCMNSFLDHKPKRILIWKIYANLCRFDLRLNSFHWTKLLLWEAPNTSQNCWFLRVLRCPQTPAAMAMPPGQSLFHSHLSGLLHSGHCLFAVKGCCVRLHSHWLNSLFCCLHGHNTVKSYVVANE